MLRNLVHHGPSYLLRLATGDDLLEAIGTHAREEGVTQAWFTGLGAVSRAVLQYYDQDAQEYEDLEFDHHLELVQLVGNVTLKDDVPFVHAHATLADDQGRAFGGHLAPGTIAFASEILLTRLEGPQLTRVHDTVTGLALWERREQPRIGG